MDVGGEAACCCRSDSENGCCVLICEMLLLLEFLEHVAINCSLEDSGGPVKEL